ncbi:MAG: alpha/beta hydrolase [Clostridia bacterium]|nr:alpha/beta hydrolase [Clostridia bacterium]
MKENAVIYIHGKGGTADEAEHYKTLFPDCDVIGFDYHAKTPWEAKDEFTEYFDQIGNNYNSVILIANSIGAFFTMNANACEKVEKAFFISPIVDMERLITDMMMWAGVTEDDLHQKKEIATDFGETLSWEYLCYVKENPLTWAVPTHILYGEKDNLTSIDTVRQFARKIGATLDVMPGGEHWFHTEAQMSYVDRWIKRESLR